MLFSNLERQGLDLSIDGNLIYFDVNRRRIGVNTTDPEYTVHIKGSEASPIELFVEGNAQITSNLTIGTTNKYTFPNTDGVEGAVLTSNGQGNVDWTLLSGISIDRKIFNYTIAELPSGAFHDFIIDIGISSIVYGLTVSRPCLVEVFGNEQRVESNPYTFLATLGHLTDDGTVLLNDGSIIQQRQYSIFANQEDPIRGRVYGRITNTDGITGSLEFSMTFFTAVTDNITGVYDMNLVNTLPATGYTGQTIVNTSTNSIHVWYNNQWNAVK